MIKSKSSNVEVCSVKRYVSFMKMELDFGFKMGFICVPYSTVEIITNKVQKKQTYKV